ncbi:hypothetical protein Trydic_g13034 [Trypoxylus dichotomus]
MEIKDFENLVKPLLKDGETFLSYECESLLPPGENYGSTMLDVRVKITNENGEEKTVYYVGKTPPPPGLLWSVFNTKVTFKKEIALYNSVIPIFNEFGRERGVEHLIEFIAECKCARTSLNPESTEVDANAALLMENLKLQGYSVDDRFIGFDFETTKLLLRDLATLHSTVIAFKLAKPQEFEAKILPNLSKHPLVEFSKDLESQSHNKILEPLRANPECAPYVSKLEAVMANITRTLANPPETREIFKTLTHNDYWVNNTMVKYENDQPVSNKMVDFQMIEFTSLANDVIFFLYSSVELNVLENHLDKLFEYYYNSFVESLKKLGGDVSDYTFEEMMEEFAIVGKEIQLYHVLFMLMPIMTLKGKAKELSEIQLTDILAEESSLHENYHKRMKFVVLDFGQRGWL